MMNVRRTRAALLAGAMLLAACGGSSGDSEPSTTDAPDSTEASSGTDAPESTDAPDVTDDGGTDTPVETDPPATNAPPVDPEVELEASFRGVTETEIHVGITMIDFDELVELNLAPEGWGDQEAQYQAFIDDVNERGGIAGRTIVPHYESYSVLAATAAEEKCTAVTKDIETFVVLGGFVGPAEEANRCITELNNTILIGGRQTADRLESSNVPWIDAPALRERRLDAMLSLLDQTGRLDGVQLAVIGSLEQQDVAQSATAVIESFGIDVVLEATNDAPQGDPVASDARWDVLAQNIEASGANTVLIIGSGQAALRGTVRNGLDVERWVLESTDLENLGNDTVPEDAAGALTMAGLTDELIWASETTDVCKEIIEAANIPGYDPRPPEEHVDGDERWYRGVAVSCRNVSLLETLVNAAGPNPTQDSFLEAVHNAGSFSVAGSPFSSLGEGKYDLGDTFLLSEFDPASGENGGLVPITEPIDGTP